MTSDETEARVASQLQQLENNEAILLMYLAGELSGEDRAEVEQLLASDAGLREEAARLSDVQGKVSQWLAHSDGSLPLVVSEAVAVRNVLRAAREWKLRGMPAAREPVKSKLLFPWWAYPSSAAAAILLCFLVWWGAQPDRNGPYLAVDTPPRVVDDRLTPDEMADRLQASIDLLDVADGEPLAVSQSGEDLWSSFAVAESEVTGQDEIR